VPKQLAMIARHPEIAPAALAQLVEHRAAKEMIAETAAERYEQARIAT
jgi:hypothetical protein